MGRTSSEQENSRVREGPPRVMGVADAQTPKSILVVDDNQDILSFMHVALEQAGYAVRTTREGAHALAMQARREADLLITDIFMPGQDGIETLRDCRRRFPQTRVIVMSAGGGSGRKLDYLPAAALIGAHATLRKPFNVDELLDTVARVLRD